MKHVTLLTFLLLAIGFCKAQFTVTATVDRDTICPGETIQLSANASLFDCGISYAGCTGADVLDSIGNGYNVQSGSFTTNQTIYGNFKKGFRMQYLYTASELNALFGAGGVIKALAWEVGQFNSNATLQNFVIRIGCVPADTLLLNTWQQGLTLVYGPKTYTPISGWNNHSLDSFYMWDGVSNLVVEICHYNPATSNNLQNMMVYTTEPGKGLYISSNNDVCGDTVGTVSASQRPKLRLRMCQSPTTVVWTSNGSGSITNPNNFTTSAAPFGTQTYQAVVTQNGISVSSNPVTVMVKQPGSINLIAFTDTVKCPSDSILVQIDSNYTNVVWSNGSTAQTIELTQAGLFTISASDTANCSFTITDTVNVHSFEENLSILQSDTFICTGDSVLLTVSLNGVNYLWQTAETTQSIYATVAGTYHVNVSGTQCPQDTVLLNATIAGIITPQILYDSSGICQGGGLFLYTQQAYDTYSWSTGASAQQITVPSSGSYAVTVTENGCTDSATATINFNILPQPQAQFIILPDATNSGNNVLDASPDGAQAYRWETTEDTLNGLIIAQITNTDKDTLYCDERSLTGTGFIRLNVTDVSGCQSQLTNWKDIPSCLSSVEEATLNTLNVYPNPVKEELTIEPGNTFSGYCSLSVTNVLGQNVLNRNVNGNIRLDVGLLPAGLYHLVISDSNFCLKRSFIKE